jgi:predicted DNA binding CopG/RHH family protein
MAKSTKKKSPVIVIQLPTHDKTALKKLAARRGMQVATLCRSILLKELENNSTAKIS